MRNPVLCSIAVAVCVSACVCGGNSASPPVEIVGPDIALDIQGGSSASFAGYVETTASDGKIYRCKYSGKNTSGGDVTFTTRGTASFTVNIPINTNYLIRGVRFSRDERHQLKQGEISNAKSKVTILDTNDAVQTAYYTVLIDDRNSGTEIPCDPKIVNR